MGRNKALLPFGGYDTLAEYQYRRLTNYFTAVYLSVKTAELFDFDAPAILDPMDTDVYAPTAGFIAAFEQLDDERLFALSVDTPFVDEAEIATLVAADRPGIDATIAKSPTRSHPMCGIYHRSLLNDFYTMLRSNDHRLGKLLSKRRTRAVDFPDERPFTNLNHPNEYDDALRQLTPPLV